MDKILKKLQGKAFHLSHYEYDFLSNRYGELIRNQIPPVSIPGTDPEAHIHIIDLHRKQFHSSEYSQSRLDNPTTGTIDHLHAEITAANAVRLGTREGIRGYGLELLRLGGHMHDSDRSFPLTMIQGEDEVRHDPAAYREHKKLHVDSSADRVSELADKVRSMGDLVSTELVDEIRYIILLHETGGIKTEGKNQNKPSFYDPSLNLNDLADILRDADSLAYFDANILTNWEECGRDPLALSNKIHFMFDRMSAGTQEEFRLSILHSDVHILGSNGPDDKDIRDIRSLLLKICSVEEVPAQ